MLKIVKGGFGFLAGYGIGMYDRGNNTFFLLFNKNDVQDKIAKTEAIKGDNFKLSTDKDINDSNKQSSNLKPTLYENNDTSNHNEELSNKVESVKEEAFELAEKGKEALNDYYKSFDKWYKDHYENDRRKSDVTNNNYFDKSSDSRITDKNEESSYDNDIYTRNINQQKDKDNKMKENIADFEENSNVNTSDKNISNENRTNNQANTNEQAYIAEEADNDEDKNDTYIPMQSIEPEAVNFYSDESTVEKSETTDDKITDNSIKEAESDGTTKENNDQLDEESVNKIRKTGDASHDLPGLSDVDPIAHKKIKVNTRIDLTNYKKAAQKTKKETSNNSFFIEPIRNTETKSTFSVAGQIVNS